MKIVSSRKRRLEFVFISSCLRMTLFTDGYKRCELESTDKQTFFLISRENCDVICFRRKLSEFNLFIETFLKEAFEIGNSFVYIKFLIFSVFIKAFKLKRKFDKGVCSQKPSLGLSLLLQDVQYINFRTYRVFEFNPYTSFFEEHTKNCS